MMKRKITHIITGLNTGGAERSLYNLLLLSSDSEFEHIVISLLDEGTYGAKIRDLGVAVFCLNLKNRPHNLFFQLPRILRKNHPKIIQGWMYHGNVLAFFARLFIIPNSRLCWNIRHGLHAFSNEKLKTRWLVRLGAWLSSYVNIVIFNSRTSKLQHAAIGFHDKNTHVIPNGFDTQQYHPSKKHRMSILEGLSIPQDSKIVGHVGRYHPDKGHEAFLNAILPIVAKDNGTHALMIGKSVEYCNDDLASKIPKELGSKIHLLGERNDIAKLLTVIDVFVQSSRTEAFPNALGEAMCAGIACVATDVGDSSLILGMQELIVDPNDVKAIQEKTQKLLISTEDCERFGQVARERILRHYTLRKMFIKYECVYLCLTKTKNSAKK